MMRSLNRFAVAPQTLLVAVSILMTAACQSPAKKHHQDRQQKVNTFQNPNAEATTKPEKRISSGNLTDSLHRTDTGAFKPN